MTASRHPTLDWWYFVLHPRRQCAVQWVTIIVHIFKDATMVGFREKSGKSDQMPYFSQILVGFLGHQRNLEEFSSNSEIYLHDNV